MLPESLTDRLINIEKYGIVKDIFKKRFNNVLPESLTDRLINIGKYGFVKDICQKQVYTMRRNHRWPGAYVF